MANKDTVIKLTEEQIKLLSSLPEQGMGYQTVDIRLKDGTELYGKVVLNSTWLQLNPEERINPLDIEKITITGNG